MPPKKAAAALAVDFAGHIGNADLRQALHSRLLTWYAANARPLPWRNKSIVVESSAPHKKLVTALEEAQKEFLANAAAQKRDVASNAELLQKLFAGIDSLSPYHILVCEIMSQQTRISVVVPFFMRWLLRFPTAAHLAAAPCSDQKSDDKKPTGSSTSSSSIVSAHHMWSGLGFYRRCNSLHGAAAQLMQQKGQERGVMPATIDGLKALPGVGPYTAAAVGSTCFGLEEAVVDGNVIRVVSRLHGLRECDITQRDTIKDITLKAQAMIRGVNASKSPKGLVGSVAGFYNNAMMEVGATICLPNAEPDCKKCPFFGVCRAQALLANGEISAIYQTIPRPKEKAAKAEVFGVVVKVTRARIAAVDKSGKKNKKKNEKDKDTEDDGEKIAIFQRDGGTGSRSLLKGFWGLPAVTVPSLAAFQRPTSFSSQAALKKLVIKAFTDAQNAAATNDASSSFKVDESIPFVLSVLNDDDDDDNDSVTVSMPSALSKTKPHHVRHVFSHIDYAAVVVNVTLPAVPAIAAPAAKGSKKKTASAVSVEPYPLHSKTSQWELLKDVRTKRSISNLDEKLLLTAGVDRRRERED